MEMKVQIPFQQLLHFIRSLPPAQKARIHRELSRETESKSDKDSFMDFLLDGPVYSEQEIAVIEENHKSISAWRTKA